MRNVASTNHWDLRVIVRVSTILVDISSFKRLVVSDFEPFPIPEP